MSTFRRQPACPICEMPVKYPNRLVRYHVRYERPIVILACMYCNYTEYLLRTGQDIRDCSRAIAVSTYMLKYGIKL